MTAERPGGNPEPEVAVHDDKIRTRISRDSDRTLAERRPICRGFLQ